jgi:hypothetical protein
VLLGGPEFPQHRRWIALVLAVSGLAVGWFVWEGWGRPDWPGGGSRPGLTLGTAGGLLILFEFALWPRKLFRRLRLGTARAWMRAHIWLGLLCVPLAVLHTGLRLGGPLSTALLAVLAAVIVSGVFGLALQQFLPRLVLERVPAETVASQIEHVMDQQALALERMIEAACVGGGAAPAVTADGAEPLRAFFRDQVAGYLRRGRASRSPLRLAARSEVLFGHLRAQVGPTGGACVDEMERLCGQRRQLDLQSRLQFWLHSWLCLHLPLSVALVVLLFVHVAGALKYWYR